MDIGSVASEMCGQGDVCVDMGCTPPHPGRPLKWAACIILECILVSGPITMYTHG